MRRVNLKAGEVLFHKGDAATDAYVIIDGAIEISGNSLNTIMENPELFGESGLVGNPRMADAIARTDCRLMAFSVDELRNAIRTVPDTAEKMIEVMIRRLAFTCAELEKAHSAAG